MSTATTTSRPAAIQFSSSEDTRGLAVHQEEESESTPQLKDLSLSLTRTKTSESTSSGTHRRRSSLAALADRLRSRSHSRTRSTSGQLESGDGAGTGTSSGRNSIDEDYQFKYTNRRSSDFTGAYADVARAQALFMEKLREEQERKNIKQNADGMPIPPPMHRRRSSVTHILGMDKPLLAR
ncbi:hypothetical protein BGZ72_008718 [Mortierella alpina]|nr:hypothetical protein BGZ72_008718 [Mortierella alpina]